MNDGTEKSPEAWARVEIFGHRSHYGRVRNVEQFGAKMLQIDVPQPNDTFESLFYAGAAIFSFQPMTEEMARKGAQYSWPRSYTAQRLPPPEVEYDEDEIDIEVSGPETVDCERCGAAVPVEDGAELTEDGWYCNECLKRGREEAASEPPAAPERAGLIGPGVE